MKSERMREIGTQGGCGELAAAVLRRYGGCPLLRYEDGIAVHAAVRLPSGVIIDLGEGGTGLRPVSMEEFRRACKEDFAPERLNLSSDELKELLIEMGLDSEVSNNPVLEYWIDHSGQAELAEDSKNHASIVIEGLAREILEHSGISIDEPGSLDQCEAEIKQRIYDDLNNDKKRITFDLAWSKDPAQTFYNWLKARGVHKKYPAPGQFDDAFFIAYGCSGNRDPRDYGLKYWGRARVLGNNVQVYEINPDVLRNVVQGLNDILEQEGDWYGDAEEPKFNIEVMKTKKFYQNVPFSVLESGDLGALRVY